MLLDSIRGNILQHAKHISPITTEAQMYLESGYRPGQQMSTLASPPNHNLFGIKANDPDFTEAQKWETWEWFDTKEWDGKKWITIKDKFRIYPSYEASIKDHDNFFVSTPARFERYRKTREATTLEEEITELGKSGYATDPDYAKKIRNMIKDYNIDEKYDTSKIAKFNKKGTDKMATAPLKIEKKLISYTGNVFANTGKKIGITLHQSGAPAKGWDADRMHQYQLDMSKPSNHEDKSWHYQVDDIKAIQSFSHAHGCWAASDGSGDGNRRTIQIEACINADGNYAKSIENTAKLMAWICYKEGFNPDTQIYTHYHWSTKVGRSKWCPAQILNGQQGYTLSKVIQMTKDELAKLKGEKSAVVDSGYNPQGLATTQLKDYVAPRLSFDELKVGDTVTLSKNWQWVDLSERVLLQSKKYDELLGTKDKIVEVKEIEPANHSKLAYKVENSNSWILQEYVEESFGDAWEIVEPEEPPITEEDGKNGRELEEGQFYLNGVLYQVVEIK